MHSAMLWECNGLEGHNATSISGHFAAGKGGNIPLIFKDALWNYWQKWENYQKLNKQLL